MNNENETQIVLRYSVYELNRIIVSILDTNNILNKKFISNVKALFECFSSDSIRKEYEKEVRVYLIKKLTKEILEKNIDDRAILLNTLDLGGKYEAPAIEILNDLFSEEITEFESQQIDAKVSALLKFSIVEQTADDFVNLINSVKQGDYEDLGDIIDNIEEQVDGITRGFKNARTTIDESNSTVSFDSPSLVMGKINSIIEREKNPATRIKTGLKTFNQMLSGGYEAGRVYCALGLAKNFKSGFLLNSVFWAKKYNKDIKPKDPTKRPVILYITLENSINETFLRMLSYCEGDKFKIEDHSPQDVTKILSAHRLFTPEDQSEMSIEFMYKSNNSINASDIDIIIDDYAKNGKEVVFLVVDYLKRLKAVNNHKELRIKLGNITDELHTLAVERDIPILTAMQLNRNAMSEVDQATSFEAKIGALQKIGGSNVGESVDIIQNVDVAFTVAMISDLKLDENNKIEYNDKFFNIKAVASRVRLGDIDNFMYRFKPGNGMSLVEDANASISQAIINSHEIIKDKIANSQIKTSGKRTVNVPGQ